MQLVLGGREMLELVSDMLHGRGEAKYSYLDATNQ